VSTHRDTNTTKGVTKSTKIDLRAIQPSFESLFVVILHGARIEKRREKKTLLGMFLAPPAGRQRTLLHEVFPFYEILYAKQFMELLSNSNLSIPSPSPRQFPADLSAPAAGGRRPARGAPGAAGAARRRPISVPHSA
jgi:hypothetical protein